MAEKPQKLTLPLLVTRSLVVFPGNTQIIEAGRKISIEAIKIARTDSDNLIFVSCQKRKWWKG